MFSFIRHYFSTDLAIDLGTANTLIYVRDKGVVLNEPSVVAILHQGGPYGKKVIKAVGAEAKAMLGRTPGNIEAIRPMKDGVIADFTITEQMIKHFIKRVHPQSFLNPIQELLYVYLVVQLKLKGAIRESAQNAGALEVQLIEEPMAVRHGRRFTVHEASGSMVVDIGGGTTEVGVISLRGMVYKGSVRVGGDKFDEAIINFIKRSKGMLIGEPTAEYIKKSIGTACPRSGVTELEVKGRDVSQGLPVKFIITSSDVLEALTEPLKNIVAAVRNALEGTPPELASDVKERGIVLTGGGALLCDIDRLISDETGVPVRIADDPLTCVVRGCGKALEAWDKDGIYLSSD